MSQTTSAKAAAGTADFLDERLGVSKIIRGLGRKVFPDHWSFMLGEIALYSFIVLLLSGTFLTLWFDPSMTQVTYNERYGHSAWGPVNGDVPMSAAFASTLHLSFDIRGGLLMRQIHHWAALLFIASMTVHMFRVFFTGAFRKPREINWLIGTALALLGLGAGFSGYSLPDDVLSGNGLRIIDGVIKSIPVVGTYASFFLFGGEFPGESIIPRLYIIHVLLIPGIILALIGVHLGLVFMQKHTQYPGPGRANSNVVGFPLMPVYMAKAGGFFFMVFGVIALLGATVAINPVWNYGPYDPSPVSAGTQPDWYILWIDGALRLMPALELYFAGFTLSLNILIPGLIIPGIVTTLMVIWPFLEQWVTGDRREHHVLDRPRNVPVRTGAGVAAIVFYVVLALAATNDLIATHLHLSINDLTWTLRVLAIIGPPIAFVITKRVCLGMQRKDREMVLHGRETGRVVQTAEGEFFEVHEPVSRYDRWLLVQHDSHAPLELPPEVDQNGVARPGVKKDNLRKKLSHWFYEDRVEPPTPSELAASHHDGQVHEAIEEQEARAVTAGTEVTTGH